MLMIKLGGKYLLIFDFHESDMSYAVGSLHLVEVCSVASISNIYAAFIIRVQVNRADE
jgi:hypothetical protein